MKTIARIVFISILAFSGSARANIITAASASRIDVASAIVSALDGDTVIVPAGSATWTSGLVVTKAITLQGAGIGSTIILDGITISGNSPLLKVTSVANKNTRVTGIEFGNSGAALQTNGVIQLAGADWNNSTIRFDNCKLNLLNGVSIQTYNLIGVIDHCTFVDKYGVSINVQNGGWGNVGNYGDNSWVQPSGFGTSQFLFIETNTFTGLSTGSDAVDSSWGGRYVFRYNTVINAAFGGHGTESGGQHRGEHAVEGYHNSFSGTISGWEMATIRSGVFILHDNTDIGWPGNTTTPRWTLKCYRLWNAFNPWGGADGTNQWDINLAGGPFYTGTTSSAGSLTVTVSGTPWTTNQSYRYGIKKTSGSTTGMTPFAQILSNTSNTITFSGNAGYGLSSLSFSSGNTFAIYKVTQALDQPGVSGGSLLSNTATPSPPSGWNNQTVEPCYQWNNTYNLPGGGTAPINFAASTVNIISNTHYFNGTAKPGYTPYTYPHPLVSGQVPAPTNLTVVQ